MSRVFLVLALVAMLLLGAAAQAAPARKSGKSLRSSRRLCAREFPGCRTCSGSIADGDYTCDVCAGKNTSFDEAVAGECACIPDFGTFSSAEWRKFINSASTAKFGRRRRRTPSVPKGCVRCDAFAGCTAVDGRCVFDYIPPSVSSGRRLFSSANEDLWA